MFFDNKIFIRNTMLKEQRTNCMVHWVYHVPNGRHNDGIIYRFIGLIFLASRGLSGLVTNPDVKIIFFPYKIIYGLTNPKVRLFKIPGCVLLFAHEFTVSSRLICSWSLMLPTPFCCLFLAHAVSHSWNTLLAIVLTTWV